MRFGLTANLKRPDAQAAVSQCLEWAIEHEHTLVLADNLSDLCPDSYSCRPLADLAPDVDMLITLGGDGTLLASARAVGGSGTPMFGVNLGSLGFLTQTPSSGLRAALDRLAAGSYAIESRMLLTARLSGNGELESALALNDVVVNHGELNRVISVTLSVNDEEIVTVTCDGLIVATPTGSTAYSMAVGGPIVKPTMAAMLVAPISPFALSMRPMLFGADDQLSVRMNSPDRVASLTLDGQVSAPMEPGDTVTVAPAEQAARFVVFPEVSFYGVLTKKLGWGNSPRGE